MTRYVAVLAYNPAATDDRQKTIVQARRLSNGERIFNYVTFSVASIFRWPWKRLTVSAPVHCWPCCRHT